MLLYRLSQTFNSSLDLEQVLNNVMDEVIAALQAERGFVMLREADGDLSFRVARGLDRTMVEGPEFQVSRGVVDHVAREGQPVLTSDAQQDDRFSMRESVQGLGLRSILCVPLRAKDRVSGVLYVDNRMQAGIFQQPDLDLLTAIASSAAIAIDNAQLFQVAVEKGRMERELQMARDVQEGLLPQETPQIAGWEFAVRWQPARQVAGDYYDFIPSESGSLGLVIGDVSDKGMPAALFMALTRSIVRASVVGEPSPIDGITRANRLICADSTAGMFVTLFYTLLDPSTRELIYVNGGHNPPLLCRAGESQLTRLMPTGMALGVLDDAPYKQESLQLDPGDFVVLYTDGVTDATNRQEQVFGMERLQRVLLDHRDDTAVDIVAALEQAIDGFVGTTEPFDDIAIVVIRCQS
jgi:serine phosphatase RsbU (regulator of sigma subunit)